jgi:hypothetical protein
VHLRRTRGPAPDPSVPSIDLQPFLAPDDRPVAGVEQGLRVLRDTLPVDFALLGDLLALGERLDPGDPHARRGPWGGVVTAGGRDARIATPPVALEAGFGTALRAWTEHGRHVLREALPDGLRLDGCSTLLAFELADGHAKHLNRIVDVFGRRFGSAMTMLLDRSPARRTRVRAQRGRLEIEGDFVEGDALTAALVFAAGATRACLAAGHGWRARRRLPLPVREKSEPWYERATLLRNRLGPITAQAHLASAWTTARPHAESMATPAEIALVDAFVTGARPLPAEAERRPRPDDVTPSRVSTAPPPGWGGIYVGLVLPRQRGDVAIDVHVATWDVAVFRLRRGRFEVYATIPRRHLQSFLDALDAGRLDPVVAELLATGAGGISDVA